MTNKPLIDADKPIFTISAVAQHLKVHQRTLRVYDDEKILCPERSPGSRRLYSFNDIEKGKFIKYLTQTLSLNLAGVKITLGLLKKLDVPPDNYFHIINETAYAIKLDKQNDNLSKRE